MVIHGHIENGVIVPHGAVSLPEGAEVTIVLRDDSVLESDRMTPEQRATYLAGLAEIDALPNENPGDTFRGADHDQALYG